LTNAQLQVRIQDSTGEAELARARKQGEQTVVLAEAELNRSRRQADQLVVMADADLAKSRRQAEQTVVTAQAQSESRILVGKGEAQRILQEGLSEAAVLLRRISCYGDPRLYALGLVTDHLSKSAQPLVPERLFVAGGGGGAGDGAAPQPSSGMLGMLINLLVAEKSGMSVGDNTETAQLKIFADQMTAKVMDTLQQPAK
jgi:multidrug efflux pump subunit AcrA (membrane-fusion protein)